MSINSHPLAPRLPSSPLELDEFLPFFLNAIANRWTATSSRLYLNLFGFGIAEWRVLGILGSTGFGDFTEGASANQMAQHLGVDAAAISRAVSNLLKLGMIERVSGKFVGRTKPYRMTDLGVDAFEKAREVAMRRQAAMLMPLQDSEKAELLRLLKKIHEGLPNIDP